MPNLVKESDLREYVRDLASLYRWEFYFTHRSQFSPAGYPDVTLVRPPRLIFAELKASKGQLTGDQVMWLEVLQACGVEVYVWWPEDMQNIQEVLSGENN